MSLTLDELRSKLNYDPVTGVFRWTASHGSSKNLTGKVAGTDVDGYVCIKINSQVYKGHRLAWFYTHGEWPNSHLDHKDRNRSNNALINLRPATRSQNAQNRPTPRGVHQVPTGQWRARIQINGSSTVLGYYDTPEAAHAAYIEAKKQVHPFWEGGKS